MKSKRFLSCLLSALFALSIVSMPSVEAFAATTQRLQGQDRYGTAIAISNAGWQTSDNVVLATGEDFPDALSAAPLAKQLNAPILLAGKTLDSILETELNRLQAKNVFIVGGEGVVSKDIQNKLEEKKLTVTRLSGNDRYETSLKIADYIADNFNAGNEIVVATGEGFPDALSIAPIAANKGMPIVLSSKDVLSDDAKSYIKDNKVAKAFVIGGTGVVSDKVMQQLPLPERVAGIDRFATNIAVLNRFAADLSFNKAYIATGNDFPDALAGSALASKTASPIILVDKALTAFMSDYINSKLPIIEEIGILGGEGAVSSSILTDNVYGNTNGNIANFGLVAAQGDWIYYNNGTLTKSKADGTGKVQLSSDIPGFINVVGDWVYYLNVISDTDMKIYKIKTDGTNRLKLSDDLTANMAVVGDWIYYMNGSDSGKLYKMRTDGTSKTKISDDFAFNINVEGDQIYYIDKPMIGQLYKINADSTGRTKLSNAPMAFVNVSDGWIYFEGAFDADGQECHLYKMKTDGSGLVKLSDDDAGYINVSGDWIYYAIGSDSGKLYKMKTDGTGRVKINDDEAMLINTSGDWLYYAIGSQKNIVKIKTDGTGKQILN
ncbi:MAG TPA: hypothetical protein DD429_02850 [Clostridiaceae bacterium]|nr:hypothetical protein [Clostridiaceae bacterium]